MNKEAHMQEVEAGNPLRQWLLQIGLLIVVLAAVFCGAIWLYQAGKVWRAHSLAREATGLIDHQQLGEAQDKLTAAYHLAPNDAEVIRACARCCQANRDLLCLDFYHKLLSLPNIKRSDIRDTIRANLMFGNVKAASDLAEKLIVTDPDVDDWVCEAQVLWMTNQAAPALRLMRKEVSAAPENRSYQLLLAQMLASLSNDAGQIEAMSIFQNLAKGKDTASLSALIAISRAHGLDKDSLRAVLGQLHDHPLQDEESRFAAWELEAWLGDRPAKIVLQEVVDYYKTADLPEKSRAARWLYGHDQPELALELATQSDAIENKDLFLVRLDALAHMGDWSEVEHELADTHIPISQTLVYLYRARAAEVMGDPAGCKSNWDRARDAAMTEPGMLAYLGNYALQVGEFDEAVKSFERMTQSPTDAEAGYAALLPVVAQHGSPAELLDVLQKMTTALPQKMEAKNDWAYLSLLLNVNQEKAADAAHELVADHPEMLAYRSTLALACLRKNDFSGAESLYQGQVINWQTAPSSWKMIYAVVLTANGNAAQAKALARTIDRTQLRPVELNLLNTWLPGPY